MKLVASMIVRNELGRYLEPCLRSLLEFCDEIRILDDASDEPGWPHSLNGLGGNVVMKRTERSMFYEHEGKARNVLLDWTLAANPTHVLAIDADEFITDGALVRNVIEANPAVGTFTLSMEEIWKIDGRSMYVRTDGRWGPNPVPILWKVPSVRERRSGLWQIREDKPLATGRTPKASNRGRAYPTGESILHMGWANEAARRDRYQRYMDHDGGRYHDIRHLHSIMLPDRRVRLRRRPWPASMDCAEIVARTNPPVAA